MSRPVTPAAVPRQAPHDGPVASPAHAARARRLAGEFQRLTGLAMSSPELAALPDEFLATPAPAPAEILSTMRVSPRTSNCLRRHVPRGLMAGEWTYGQLVRVTGFGLGALVEVLHAQAAAVGRDGAGAPAPDEAAVDPAWAVDEALALIAQRLPAPQSAIARWLEERGLPRALGDLGRLEHLLRAREKPCPFAVLRMKGAEAAAVPRAHIDLARKIHDRTTRLLVAWGMTTIYSIAFQVGTDDLPFVAAVVSLRQGFEWLDQERGWFWTRSDRASLLTTLARLFSVVPSVPLGALAWALFGRRPPDHTPPLSVLAQLCRRISWLELTGDLVRAPLPPDTGEPGNPLDQCALAVFARWGPTVAGPLIPAIAQQLGATAAFVRRALRTSPLVIEPEPAVFRLVGSKSEPHARPATRPDATAALATS